jgi:predicted phosphodiesterase
MKIAVLSDIHGNYAALEAVVEDIDRWQPDVTVVNGDVVNRGPCSVACWDLVRQRQEQDGWRIVGGNHEAYVAAWLDRVPEEDSRRFEVDRSSYWTYCQLNGRAPALAALPSQVEITGPDGSVVRLTHGSMRGARDGIYHETPPSQMREQIAPAPDVFCTAHTHKPLLRELDGTLLINSGSAGTSFDGDPRLSYARLTWEDGEWRARIVRLPYDWERMARDFEKSGFREGGGPLVDIFYEEWRSARPLINRWVRQYEEAFLQGEIELEASVHQFLRQVT